VTGRGEELGPDRVALLEEARRREKEQTLYYRRLAASAEDEGRHDEAERLNALHADEQHHLSRLTARLLEAGIPPRELRGVPAPESGPEPWEGSAREREVDEVAFYRDLIAMKGWPPDTRAVLEEILEAETHHARELGGKWMSARPPESLDTQEDP
jgi:rubrerythrin